MARLSKSADRTAKETPVIDTHSAEKVTNFMSGTSYTLNPINTLKIVAASSIFGEPQYYRDAADPAKSPKPIKNIGTLKEYSIISGLVKEKGTAADVFTAAIDAALDFDFKATLDLALELRNDYFMRLNPAVIYVRATLHKNRAKFNEENPGLMRSIGKAIALRPDDLTNQFEYYMYINGKKNKLSSILKRTWADRLAEFSRYQLNKYKGKRLIDLVRISHATSADINELMKTGTLVMSEEDKTWETLRSAGKTWIEILTTIQVPHMALLRNLRGIFNEIKDAKVAREVVSNLQAGVPKGKQFPFRYFSAYKAIETDATVNHKSLLLEALETCMDIAVENMPKLEGKTICLSDNSGSSWGALNSEYGTVKVAEIANLSSLITAMQSDEGEIGLFGDRLIVQKVSQRTGLLKQHKAANEVESKHGRVGGGTENGIWIFFNEAIRDKKHYDNIFIYSDMQAGHGGLYGIRPAEYASYRHKRSSTHIDVLALVKRYREVVNPKVNVFTIQVAGYDNSVLPEDLYRGAILAGWTGKEPIYAKAVIDTWNALERTVSFPTVKKKAARKTTKPEDSVKRIPMNFPSK